jgi:uncharacterized protein YkwD
MGRAIILENKTGSLYSARPVYDLSKLESELANLQTAENAYAALLVKAVNSRNLLADDADIARASMNAILQQWLDGIIAAGDEEPEPLEPDDPNDPETGLPWVDPDRAQEAPLLALINDARTAASVGTVTRDNDLDAACLAHLRYQAGNGSIGHTGQWRSKPSDRATQQGYYQPDVIYELLAYGEDTPARVMSRWQREPATWANLLADDVIHAGVAHVYARRHPGSYLWAVLLASAKGDPVTNTVTEDPADAAAEDTETALDTIKAPSLDDVKPEKLGEAVRLFALAQQKLIAAQREVDKLMADKLQRDIRIEELDGLKDDLEAIAIDVWCCTDLDGIAVGTEVNTVEIPGFWNETTISGRAIIYEGTAFQTTIPYDEKAAWNIAPFNYLDASKLQPAITGSAAGVFFNTAIEPGHIRWKPLYRYGILTAVSIPNNNCSVLLNSDIIRKFFDEKNEFTIDEDENLVDVPIYYYPCHAHAFEVGDEVIVLFEDYNRETPKVIGFRRAPRPCSGRQSWNQLR